MLEWTGERYLPFVDPKICGAEIHYEHLHRYYFASKFVEGKRVLDLACGEGYGSYILSKSAEHVVGIDIDEKTIKHASSKYIRNNLEFIQGSILKIPIEGEKLFDVLVCFEAFEHVKEHEELMKGVKRLLKEDGIFIVSSPNKKVYSDDVDYNNPFHEKELYFDEFKELLKSNFNYVCFFGQRVYAGSHLWSLTQVNEIGEEYVIERRNKGFAVTDYEKKEPLYFIAITSDKEIDISKYALRSYLTDANNTVFDNFRGHIHGLEGEVAEVRKTIAQKDDRIRDFEVSLEDRNQHIQSLEGEVSEVRKTIAQKDERVRELEASLEDRNQHIQSLEGEVSDIRKAITEKDERIREFEVSLEDRNQHIQSLEGEVVEVRNAIAQKDDRIREIEMENLRINTERNSMKSSVTWRTVMKWHSLVEKLMPPMTRRRRWYDLGIIGLRTIANKGCGSFWWKFKQHRASKKFVKSRNKSPKLDILSEDFERKVDSINKKVSIVIPTKNAGSDFEFILEKIENQKGIEETEIIIVDSGSTDETVKLAEKYGAKVYSIKPEEFNHGETRNYGAEKATGDYILFMVQDAIPIGDYWLYNMVKVLESDSQIAAATCRQVPRSNADLFACFSIWNHHKALDFYEDRIAEQTGDFDKLLPIEKRKLCGLDDMCNLVRKDVFDKFKFKKIQYAEDIDLGLKLIKGGHKLAFLHSVGVVHSHNRDASYFLRRYYVDNKILQRIFNYREYYPECNFDELLYSILALYSALNLSAVSTKDFLQHTSDGNRYPDAIIKLEGLIQENLKVSDIQFNGDQFLNEFFHKIDEIIVEKRTNDKLMNFVLSQYLYSLKDLKEFITAYNPTEEDFIATLYNLFSIVVASAFAIKLPEYKDKRAYMIESLSEGGV